TRRHFFAARPEKSRAADRREKEGKLDAVAEYRRSQINVGRSDGGAGTEHHVVEHARVLAHRPLRARTAVDVIKDDARKAPLRDRTEVGDVDDRWRIDAAHSSILSAQARSAAGSTCPRCSSEDEQQFSFRFHSPAEAFHSLK